MNTTLKFTIEADASGVKRVTNETGESFEKIGNKAEQAGRTASASFAKSLNSIGSRMQQFGAKASMFITAPIVGAAAAAVKFATDFNKSMANVATLIPGNAKRIDELKKSVQNLSIETGKSTGDMADGLYQVISAFGDSADTVKILETNAKAAAAGLATTTDAINLTSAVTKGYGDVSAEAVKKAADLAFETVKLGQTTFPELAASIGQVVPVAAKMNVAQEEMFAGFATLTGVTGNAAEVSTQLAAILRSMIKPTKGMKTAIAELGYSSAEAMTQELGMVGALQALIGTTDGSTEAVGKLFGRAEALTAVFALTGASSDTFKEKLTAMGVSAGAMGEAFDEQTKGVNKFGFTIDQLKKRLAVTAQTFGDALLPVLAKAVEMFEGLSQSLMKAAEWFANLSGPTQTAIIAIAAVAAAIGPLLVGFGMMATAISTILPIIGGLVAVLTGPVGIALAIAAVVTALVIWASKNETVMKVLSAAWTWLKDSAITIWTSIKELSAAVSDAISAIWKVHGEKVTKVLSIAWENIKLIFGTAFDIVKNIVKGAWTIISGIFSGTIDVIKGLVKVFHGALTGDFKKMGEGLKDIVSGMWKAISSVFKGAIGAVVGMVKDMYERVTGFFKNMYEKTVGHSFVPEMMEGIKAQFSRLPGIMERPAEDATGDVIDSFGGMNSSIAGQGGILSEFTMGISGIFGGIRKIMSGEASAGVNDVIGNFENMIDTVTGMIRDWKQTLMSLFKSIAGSILDSFFGGEGGLLSKFKKGFSDIFSDIGGSDSNDILGKINWGKAGGAILGGLGSAGKFLLGGLTNPVTAIIAGAAAAGFGIYKLADWIAGPNSWEAMAEEVARDYGGLKISPAVCEDFGKAFGITESEAWSYRKNITSSPQFLLMLATVAAQQNKMDAFLGSLKNVQTSWGSHNFHDSFVAGLESGDWSALNTMWLNTSRIGADKTFGGRITGGAESLFAAMGGYQHGTNYVPETGPYILHQGEAVVPASDNKGRGDIYINIEGPIYGLDDLDVKIERSIRRTVQRGGMAYLRA